MYLGFWGFGVLGFGSGRRGGRLFLPAGILRVAGAARPLAGAMHPADSQSGR